MYNVKKLRDFAEINPRVQLTKGQHYSFVEMSDISPGRRNLNVQDKQKMFSGSGTKFAIGDTLFARITPCLENGKIAQYSSGSMKGFGSTEFIVLRSREGVSDSGYLYYLSKTPIIRMPAEKSMSGASGRQRADVTVIKDICVPSPSLPIQRKIASILSAYDDLIENNLKRIKILEEMAQNLYREWFVKFRFPGHETAKFVESELGMIPEGWEVKRFSEIFRYTGGGTPSTKIPEYWVEGTINWYTPSDITASKSVFMECSATKISEVGLSKSSAKLFPPNCVLLTSRATIGAISINTTPASTNQGFITCYPNEQMPVYVLFHLLKERVGDFIRLGTGATFKEITKGVFGTIETIVPPQILASSYQTIITPMLSNALNLQRKNCILRQTRDLLLPKLISGEIDVSDIDIKLPEEQL